MRRGLLIVAAFILMAMSGQDAHAAKFGTKTSYQHLQDLTAKGPKGEALALGYETATHSFFLPYKMTGEYVRRASPFQLTGPPLVLRVPMMSLREIRNHSAG
jgi:hypothetical protein